MITAADIQAIRDANPGAVLPGIDTMTGNPYAASSLLDITKITQNAAAPYYYSPSANTVYVNQAGAVLSGINFGSATVIINANNVTVKDCTFAGTTGFQTIDQPSASGAIVENCTFIGSKSPTEKNVWIASTLAITVEDNTFLNSPADTIAIQQGLVTGNYMSGEGFLTGAHGDAIYVPDTTGPITISNNFIDETPNAGATGLSNTDMRITDEFGNTNNVTISGNYMIGAGFNFEVVAPNTAYAISNVTVTNNYTGFAKFGQYYAGTTSEATVTGLTAVDFSNPTLSAQAFAAYVAAGLPTANVVSASTGSISASGSAPTTMLGNGLASIYLSPGTGETNFVGGYGRQYVYGGRGPNILTYLATGDGGDLADGFDPAKDVIDLSHLDADNLTAGIQSFTFIGSAAFDGAAEVRYQLDPTNDDTLVQVALAGDTSPDFTITIDGLTPLTTANFALTPSQSLAALANGAALSYTRVSTPVGGPAEYAYSNIQGRAYTSYEAFYGSGTPIVESNELNLSSSADKLVLYEPSQTVTRGGGAESLQFGTGSDPLVYHAVETIDATTSTGEQFIFSAGFGKETINGFSVSGPTPDSIQLAKAAFSYLTPAMTQAEDLAAVMSQATRSAFGLTIADSHGDSLTLMGVTPSLVAANPGMIAFT